MNTEQIMYMVYDYADAFHNRIDSIGEVEIQTQKELKHSQIEIGKKIQAAVEALVQERDEYQAAADKLAMECKVLRDALNTMYQLLLTEPHAPTVCNKLEDIATAALLKAALGYKT